MTAVLKMPALPASLTASLTSSFAEDRKRRLSKGSRGASFGASLGPSDSAPANDDAAELLRLEQKKAAARRQSAAASPAASAAASARVLNKPQLLSIYTTCIKLANAGKINQKNVWGLQLIDVMSDVITTDDATAGPSTASTKPPPPSSSSSSPFSVPSPSAPSAAPAAALNFAKASCTLDASVMIYSGRVDSAHKDTFRVAGGLSSSHPSTHPDDPASPTRRRAKRRENRTLHPNPAQLNLRALDVHDNPDPFFKRMSAAFDAGGSKGMLMHQLSVYHGLDLALDGNTVIIAERPASREDADVRRDVSGHELRGLLDKAKGWRGMTVCPTLREMQRMKDELEGKPPAVDELPAMERLTLQDEAGQGWHSGGGAMEVEGEGGAEEGRQDLAALHADLDAAIEQEQSLDALIAQRDEDDDDEAAGTETAAAVSAASQAAPRAVGGAFPLLPSLFGSSSTSTMPSFLACGHWKFPSVVASAVAPAAPAKQRSSRATVPIDFFGPAPSAALLVVQKGKAGKKATELSDATLKNRAVQRGRGVETDVNIDRLERFFLRDEFVRPPPTHRHSLSLPHSPSDDADLHAAEANDSYDAADPLQPDDGAGVPLPTGPSFYEPQLLMSAAVGGEAPTIGYAQVAKRVDVKALKECMWAAVQAAWEASGGAAVSFQAVMDRVAETYPAQQLASVSVSYCFICVLHLCNEHGLTLESADAKAAQGGRPCAPADVGYCLSSFYVRCK